MFYFNKLTIISLTFVIGIIGNDMPKNSLKIYKKKRNFQKTPEPSPKTKKTAKKNNPLFVIQKHNASHLHYDFRIQINGVLKSWAIPKGPSMDPTIKRLAMPTEDHPIEYAFFEGIIPEGLYGAGTVMVWDIGTFDNIKQKDGKLKPIEKCYEDGEIEIWLNGQKLQGGFVLVRTNFRDKESWLFKKIDDEKASVRKNPVKTKDKSVLTERTTLQIKKESEQKPELMEELEKRFSKKIEQMIKMKKIKDE